ncbi:MAG: hypothetical protein JJU02_15250 [Cryomorphaceae bacterium]|nr:hypothetical protein [Cryomorphaceae bacterium]
MKKIYPIILIFLVVGVYGQTDLLDDLEEEEKVESEYAEATFKGTRIINLQSCELPAPGVMQFMFMHRFGAFSEDYLYNFFGLDQAVVRLSLDYSFTHWLNVGIGRSSRSKTADAFSKIRLFRQQTGQKNIPLTAVLYSTFNVDGTRPPEDLPFYPSSRLSYSHQLILARKFNERLSLQLTPTLVHFNMVETRAQQNTLFALGFSGRYKINNRVAITAEYMMQLPNNTYYDRVLQEEVAYNNSFSIGLDIETGGHVFQLHLTNSSNLADPLWISRTTGSWGNGDIYFGFNISRVFTIKEPDRAEEPTW